MKVFVIVLVLGVLLALAGPGPVAGTSDPNLPVVIRVSPEDVNAFYTVYIAPRVTAQVESEIGARITASEQRTWQRMVDADAANIRQYEVQHLQTVRAQLETIRTQIDSRLAELGGGL